MASFTNSLGMRFVEIPAGTFQMGQGDGKLDELPVHAVRITQSFFMATTPVTNEQWEQYCPADKAIRGEWGVSDSDDAALISVSYLDAVAFCEWLSQREGRPYRLPTEAEWEYACRAGTTTPYWTGENLPPEHRRDNPDVRDRNATLVDDGKDPLRVARSPPNPWGLHDMHGLVEEWCGDWYGPYENPPKFPSPGHQTFKEPAQRAGPAGNAARKPSGGITGKPGSAVDPVGRPPGYYGAWKVTRGGSYEALVEHLRSASRMAQHATSRSRFIGFRVVQAPPPTSAMLPLGPPPANMTNIIGLPWPWNDPWGDAGGYMYGVAKKPTSSTESTVGAFPFWNTPKPYINPPPTAPNAREFGLYPHNHCPALTWCDNGSVLVIWFSCVSEHDRDTFDILAARIFPGMAEFSHPSLFYKCPGRNMTGSALFNDGKGRLLHFNGNDEASSWQSLIMTMRESRDNGRTWSHPRNIGGPHGFRNQVIAGTFKTTAGRLVQLCDAVPSGRGGTAMWVSEDDGWSWRDLGAGKPWPTFKAGETGAWIAGIHACVAEIPGGFLAFGRGDDIDGRMPQSVSRDGGETWTYSASPFPPISGGQRAVLLRLHHSPKTPLAFFSFTNPRRAEGEEHPDDGIDMIDAEGKTRRVFGLFGAVSFDHGETWEHHRIVSDGMGARYPCMDYRTTFLMDGYHAEPSGYLAACQSPDGVIHLVSSAMYYKFNLDWMLQRYSFRNY